MNLLPAFASAWLAQSEAVPRPPGPAWVQMVPFALIFLVLYFLTWRPTQKQRREHQSFLSALKRGDEVVTSAGLWGRVVEVEAKVVTLELAERVRVRLLRDRVSGLWADQVREAAPRGSSAAAAPAKGG